MEPKYRAEKLTVRWLYGPYNNEKIIVATKPKVGFSAPAPKKENK